MNVLFTMAFIFGAARMIVVCPDEFLPTLLSAVSSSAALCLALLSSYAVFCGLSSLWQESGLTRAFARLLRRPVRMLFRCDDEEIAQCICMNVSANLLGIGALATPYGVKAARLLDRTPSFLSYGKKSTSFPVSPLKPSSMSSTAEETQLLRCRRERAMALLFTLNAASLQIVPTSVIALRTSVGSVSPTSVVLPVVFTSVFFLSFTLPLTLFLYRVPKPREKRNKRFKRCEKTQTFPPLRDKRAIDRSSRSLRHPLKKEQKQCDI